MLYLKIIRFGLITYRSRVISVYFGNSFGDAGYGNFYAANFIGTISCATYARSKSLLQG